MKIDYLGGNCPVQADGEYGGKPFYFRARGAGWSFGIGKDPIGASDYKGASDFGWGYWEEIYDWPAAGWIEEYEALSHIATALERYEIYLNEEVTTETC